MSAVFLSNDAMAELTGCKAKSKQIAALRKMGLTFWVNAVGKPVVPLAAIEGRKDTPKDEKVWVMPRVNRGPQTVKKS